MIDNVDDVVAAFERAATRRWEDTLKAEVLHPGDLTRVIVHGSPEELDALVDRLGSCGEVEPAIRDYITSFFLLMLETLADFRKDRRM